jgi:hypothetical protein
MRVKLAQCDTVSCEESSRSGVETLEEDASRQRALGFDEPLAAVYRIIVLSATLYCRVPAITQEGTSTRQEDIKTRSKSDARILASNLLPAAC